MKSMVEVLRVRVFSVVLGTLIVFGLAVPGVAQDVTFTKDVLPIL